MPSRCQRSLGVERAKAIARSNHRAETAVDAVRKAARRGGHRKRGELLRDERRDRVARGGGSLRVAVEIASDDGSIRQQEGQDFKRRLLRRRRSDRDSEHHAHH